VGRAGQQMSGRPGVERHVYVGLGSNLGDRAAMLSTARRELGTLGRLAECSRVYETAPWGVPDEQQPYLNQVCRLETDLSPESLLARFQEIEIREGRDRTLRLASRELDMDLLIYGQRILAAPNLTVPHALLHERAFVLAPMADIASDLVVPGICLSVADLLARVDVSGVRVWGARAAGRFPGERGCTVGESDDEELATGA